MADQNLELLIRAKNLTDTAFRAVQKSLEQLDDQQKDTTARGTTAWGKWFATIGGGVAVGNLVAGTFSAAGEILASIPGRLIAIGERGSDVADVRNAFQGLTGAIGESSDAMLGNLRQAFGNTVADFDLMKSTNEALGKGIRASADDMGLLGKGARIMADQIGGSAKQAFDGLLTAISTGQERTLKTLPVNFHNIEQAVERYAASLGKQVSELTQAEKQQGLLNGALAESARLLRENGEVQNDFTDNIAAARAMVGNWRDAIGEAIATSPALSSAMTDIATALQRVFGSDRTKEVQTVTSLIDQATIATLEFARASLQAVGPISQAWNGLRMVFDGVFSIIYYGGIRMVNLAEAAARVAAAMPGLGASMGAVADEAHRTSQRMQETQRWFHEGAQTALRNVYSNDALKTSIAGVDGALAQAIKRAKDAAGAQQTAATNTATLARVTADYGSVATAAARQTKQHTDAVTTLADSLGGNGAKREADLLNDALKRLGGTQALTRDGVVRTNRILTEALAVYRDLGQQAPKWMTDVWIATLPKPSIVTGLENLSTQLKSLRADLLALARPDVTAGLDNIAAHLPGATPLPTGNPLGPGAGPSSGPSRWGEINQQLDTLGRSLAQLGDVTDNRAVRGLSAFIVSLDVAAKAGDTLKKGWNQLHEEGGNKLAGILSMAAGALAGVTAIAQATSSGSTGSRVGRGALAGASIGTSILPGWGTAIGAAAGAIVGLVRGMNQGRAAVKDFANSLGGFDALREKLAGLGDEGERLWVTLTQGVGRGNAQQAQAAIDAVTAALAKQETQAKKTGQAAVDAAESEVAAQQKVVDVIQNRLDGLNAEYDRLFDSIKDEAPEEVMGVVEQATRARMDAVAKERDAVQLQLDEANRALEDSMAKVADALTKLTDSLATLTRKPWDVEVNVTRRFTNQGAPADSDPDLPGYARGGYIGHDQVANVHAGELIGPIDFMERALAGAIARTSGGGAAAPPIVVLKVDGREIARASTRYQRDVLAPYGVR